MNACRPCARHAPAVSGDCRRAAEAVEEPRPRRTNCTAATMAATIAGSVPASSVALVVSASAAAGTGGSPSDAGSASNSRSALPRSVVTTASDTSAANTTPTPVPAISNPFCNSSKRLLCVWRPCHCSCHCWSMPLQIRRIGPVTSTLPRARCPCDRLQPLLGYLDPL